FGSPGPARTPAPAATMMTPTSGGEATGELTDAVHADHVQSFEGGSHAGAGRAEDAAETLTRGFEEATLDAGHRPDLSAQSHLAQEQRVRGDRAVVNAGDQGRHDGQG